MKRIRTSTLVIVMLALAFLVIVGTQTSKASGSGGPAATGEPAKAAHFVTSVEPAACAADEGLASTIKVTGSGLEPAAAGGCKACKDRPWCGCTYQGHPRISCNPCCYQAYPYPICFD